MCLNSSGDVFVTGWSYSVATLEDIVTVKYNHETGDSLWVKRYVGPLDDRPLAITCDNNSVYVTGWSTSAASGKDVITIKYNASTGDTTWVKKFNGTNNGGDYGLAIYVDASGNVYVCGRTDDVSGGQKFLILKYDINGNVPSGWPVVYTGAQSTTFDEAHGVVADGSGNVYVTGISGLSGAQTFMTMKINNGGAVQWIKKHVGTGAHDADAIGIVQDNTGSNFYVGGWGSNSGTLQDFMVIKYDAAGDSLAYATYDGTANSIDVLTAIAIDSRNFVYVSGFSTSTNGVFDFATVRYNSNLVQSWVTRTSEPGNSYPSSISVSNSTGNVYVAGASLTAVSGGNYDYLVERYDSTGVLKWEKRQDGNMGLNDYACSVDYFAEDHIFVTGAAHTNPPGVLSFLTTRYTNINGITPISTNIPGSFSLSQNYPNPFNPSTTIRFSLPKSDFIKLVVYDVLGREVEVLANQQAVAGEYEVKWDGTNHSSGIYFIRLSGSNFSDTKKMILSK